MWVCFLFSVHVLVFCRYFDYFLLGLLNHIYIYTFSMFCVLFVLKCRFTTSLTLLIVFRGLCCILLVKNILQGNDIHIIIPTTFKQEFDLILTVNNIYTIANFQVQLNELLFKAFNHKYLLKFTWVTIVGDNNKHHILDKTLHFTHFWDIISDK